MAARRLYGVFKIVDDDTAVQCAPLQLSRRAAEADLTVLTERNPDVPYAVYEAHLKEPKEQKR